MLTKDLLTNTYQTPSDFLTGIYTSGVSIRRALHLCNLNFSIAAECIHQAVNLQFPSLSVSTQTLSLSMTQGGRPVFLRYLIHSNGTDGQADWNHRASGYGCRQRRGINKKNSWPYEMFHSHVAVSAALVKLLLEVFAQWGLLLPVRYCCISQTGMDGPPVTSNYSHSLYLCRFSIVSGPVLSWTGTVVWNCDAVFTYMLPTHTAQCVTFSPEHKGKWWVYLEIFDSIWIVDIIRL